MRAFRITQAQLDEIFEHPLPDHAYQILANLTVINEMIVDEPVIKAVPVHETVGMWGEPKEEPVWTPNDDREAGTVRLVKKRDGGQKPLLNFFMGKMAEYPDPEHSKEQFEKEYLGTWTEKVDLRGKAAGVAAMVSDRAVDELNAAHRLELLEREASRIQEAKRAHTSAQELVQLQGKAAFYEKLVKDNEALIFAALDKGEKPNQFYVDNFKNYQTQLKTAEYELQRFRSEQSMRTGR